MKVELKPGERLEVSFHGTDGCITIDYGEDALRAHADLPDTSGREGVIYEEAFPTENPDDIGPPSKRTPLKPKAPRRLPQPDQPLIDDGQGVVRFQANEIVSTLLESSRASGGMDLNTIAIMDFPPEDRVQFAQLIGYSVAGACDLSYFEGTPGDRAWRMMEHFSETYRMSKHPKSEGKAEKKVWRTRESVCCSYALLPDGTIDHIIGCPNAGTDSVEPVDLRSGRSWQALADAGDYIGAIKKMRNERPGLGLKEAKDALDEYRSSDGYRAARGSRPDAGKG